MNYSQPCVGSGDCSTCSLLVVPSSNHISFYFFPPSLHPRGTCLLAVSLTGQDAPTLGALIVSLPEKLFPRYPHDFLPFLLLVFIQMPPSQMPSYLRAPCPNTCFSLNGMPLEIFEEKSIIWGNNCGSNVKENLKNQNDRRQNLLEGSSPIYTST